jgi:hypothetical protein
VDDTTDVLPGAVSKEYCSQQIRLILNRFLIEVLPLLEVAGLGWDYLTVVPSRWRTRTHPLVPLLTAIGVGQVRQPLLSVPSQILTHGQPNERAFKTTESVNGKSVLLIDDVFTTGATIHSAASVLSAAGANVVAGIVIARRIRPEFNKYSSSVWARQAAKQFRWKTVAENGAAIAQSWEGPRSG